MIRFEPPAPSAPDTGRSSARDDAGLAVLYENDAWLGDLFATLERRGIPYQPLRMHDAAVDLDRTPRFPLIFNLCPAESCDRFAADPAAEVEPQVAFEPFADITPDAVAQGREIVRAANLDVGGVEYLESASGTRWFLDINATSVYRHDICEALGIEATERVVDFIERELHKEIAKRNGGGRVLRGAARANTLQDVT